MWFVTIYLSIALVFYKKYKFVFFIAIIRCFYNFFILIGMKEYENKPIDYVLLLLAIVIFLTYETVRWLR